VPFSREVQDLIVERRIERVGADAAAARRMVAAAARHIESARTLRDRDPEGAYGLLYDALRKAIGAHMEANGLRAAGQGAHRSALIYAESQLTGIVDIAVIEDLDRMRITRHDTEYSARPVSPAEVDHDLAEAELVVRAIGNELMGK
jgi:hypothetical protein